MIPSNLEEFFNISVAFEDSPSSASLLLNSPHIPRVGEYLWFPKGDTGIELRTYIVTEIAYQVTRTGNVYGATIFVSEIDYEDDTDTDTEA